MNDEFDPRHDELDEPEEAPALWTVEPVDPASHVAIIHDSFGERYINYGLLAERSAVVTILRILGAMSLEPKGEVQYFVNGAQTNAEHRLNAGDTVYIVGKLAGGRS